MPRDKSLIKDTMEKSITNNTIITDMENRKQVRIYDDYDAYYVLLNDDRINLLTYLTTVNLINDIGFEILDESFVII